MKTYKIASVIFTQILFALITCFMVYGIFERDVLITLLSFAARSCLHWMSIENNIITAEAAGPSERLQANHMRSAACSCAYQKRMPSQVRSETE